MASTATLMMMMMMMIMVIIMIMIMKVFLGTVITWIVTLFFVTIPT